MQWCTDTLLQFHPTTPFPTEFIPQQGHQQVPQWYRDLVNHARTHVRSGQEPTLALAQKPRDGYT